MKAKNILMSLLLVMGAIAAKAAGYPPELVLVSQPMMTYNANSITVYYDVENIGDYTYRGSVCLYLYPDEGYSYAEEWVKVRPGHIKRIALEIPSYRIRKGHPFTIMPYYEMGDELYSFTTFEYFEPITFYWEGPRTERWVVINIGPCPNYYHRPSNYRYYYDGFRPPMPPSGHEPRPMDPKHHTYGYHHDNGGYPATHFGEGHGPKPSGETPKPNGSEAPSATVRPKPDGGSMSHGHSDIGSNASPSPNNGNSRTGNNNVSRPSSSNSSHSTSGSVSRPASSSSNSGRVGNSNTTNRPSGTSNSSGSSSSARKGNSNSSSRVNGSNNNSNATSGTRSNSNSSTRSSNSSHSSSTSTSGSGSGRR